VDSRPPASRPDPRGAIALVLLLLGLVAATVGAALLWGPGGGCLVAGLLLVSIGVVLAWD
jgi:hypothetical protein